MLTIRDLKKTVGGRTLFENAAMQVNYGERVALVDRFAEHLDECVVDALVLDPSRSEK